MKIAVLGTGHMGGAIIDALVRAYETEVSVIAYDTNEAALRELPDNVLVCSPDEWNEPENIPDMIVLAIKPAELAVSLAVFSADLKTTFAKTLWVSIAAGVTIETLSGILGSSAKICRVMPNLPLTVGEGMSAYCLNAACGIEESKSIEYVFSACGKTAAVPEKFMNAVTGLSGSGPAYVYLFIEALIEGGVTAGLPFDVARQLAVQTVRGAVKMVDTYSTKHPAELKAQVMSPGGTTVAGLCALEANGFKHAVISAVTAATNRSAELGKK